MTTVKLTSRQIQIITHALNSGIDTLLNNIEQVPDYKTIGELKALEHYLVKQSIKPAAPSES